MEEKKKRHKLAAGRPSGDSHLDGKASVLAGGLSFMKDKGEINSPVKEHRRGGCWTRWPKSNMHLQCKKLQPKKIVNGGRKGTFVMYDAMEKKSYKGHRAKAERLTFVHSTHISNNNNI